MRFVSLASGLFCVLPLFGQYTARKNGDVVRLEDAKNHTVASIIPSVGNVTFELKVNGTNVLYFPYNSIEDFKARPGLSGIPFLSPWANRLDEDAFYANGKKYIFNMELGNVKGAIPLHGFLSSTNQWQVVEVKADRNSAWVTSKLEFYKYPDNMEQFPFAHVIEMTHRLKDGVLEVSTKLENLSAEPMPVSIGFHPYYQLTDSPREDWTMNVGAQSHFLLNPSKVPTGEKESIEKIFPNPKAVALKDYNLDDVFGDLVRDASGRATMTLQGSKSQKIEIVFGPKYHSVVLFGSGRGRGGAPAASGAALVAGRGAPAGPNAAAPNAGAAGASGRGGGGRGPQGPNMAIEPMVGITDVINLAHKGAYNDLQYVAPGQTWQESFWIHPSGF
jgi:aldose 1-epimerase